MNRTKLKPLLMDVLYAIVAGIVVGTAYYFFQNSNRFAPGGAKCGYKFEIVTTHPEELSAELMEQLHHGVTEIRVHGMYSHTDRYMPVCIINKRQIGDMMRIIKRHPDTFASFERVTEVFGNFKRSV